MTNVKIKFEDATNAQLLYYAESVLGLDGVKKGQQNQFLIGKILSVKPDAEDIEVPPEMADAKEALNPEAVVQAQTQKGVPLPLPNPGGPLHFMNDPRVVIKVLNSNDGTKPADCFINVNGDVIRIKRGHQVAIPYRHYLALENAKENVARETGEINAQTGMPIMDWSEQPSYPFSVLEMPSEDEIAEWHARTDAQGRKAA